MKTIISFIVVALIIVVVFFGGYYVGQRRAYHHSGVFLYNYVIQDARLQANLFSHSSGNLERLKTIYSARVEAGNSIISKYTKSKETADELVDSYTQQIRESGTDERYISPANLTTSSGGNLPPPTHP